LIEKEVRRWIVKLVSFAKRQADTLERERERPSGTQRHFADARCYSPNGAGSWVSQLRRLRGNWV
jgi:hypothetical protein